MECIVCGGTNFTKESGFYFCRECQTQSQEVKEHAFQEESTQIHIKSSKKIKDTKTNKSDHVTSWECYNVILMSLTEELIKLGADIQIKKIVKCLWMKYLEKLEVLNLDEDQRPKLSLVHIKRDVNVTFGVNKRKRKRKLSSESSLTESTSRRERSKKKTALAQSQYSEISSKETPSLHNETLMSLKSTSDKSDASEKIMFNKYSCKELRKNMTKKHIENHKTDLESSLNCHKFTYRTCSDTYRKGVHFISPIKIYAILYIALLIKKDPIQLGDFFRFLREGHLNFDRFTLLFPDSYSNKVLNIHNYSKKSLFAHKEFRLNVAKLVKFLAVENYIKCPNLVELVQRYCKELNLPDDIFHIVKHILSRNPMTFGKTKGKFTIPNYEARVMSVIIFILKLLYGLDGITEKKLSNFAQFINTGFPHLQMFDIQDWMEFINYRNLAVSENHFPSYHLNNTDLNVDLFLQYKKSHNIFADDRSKLVSDMVGYKNLLSKIQHLQYDYISHIEYPGNLNPFSTYSEIITNLSKENINKAILKKNFHEYSLDFLINPIGYLLKINKNITFKHGSANDNWVLEKMKTHNNCVYFLNKKNRKFVTAEIVVLSIDVGNENNLTNNDDKIRSVTDIQKDYEKYHTNKFKQNMNFLTNLNQINNQNVFPESSSLPNNFRYEEHCNAYERYWLYLRGGVDLASKPKFNDFFYKYNDNFKLIVNECSRIIDQTNQELFVEFQNTELYLIYCGHYKDAKKRKKNSKLNAYIKRAKYIW